MNQEKQESKLLSKSQEFVNSNKAFVWDIYLEYLKNKDKMSSCKKEGLLKRLQKVVYNEFGYIRPIRSVDSALRIWLGWVDPSFFAEYYLSLSPAEHQDKWRENWDKDKFLQLAARGFGKCLSRGTKIQMANGLRKKIEDVKIGDWVLSIDEETFKQKFCRVVAIQRGIHKKMCMRTDSGKEIFPGIDHRFKVITGWKEAKKLSFNESIFVPRNLNCCGTSKLSVEVLRLLGYLIGDGGTSRSCIKFTNATPSIIEDFKRCCDSIGFSVIKETYRQNKYGYCLKGKGKFGYPTDFCERFNLQGKKSLEKEVPDEVFLENEEGIKEFLDALFSCDAYVGVVIRKRDNQKQVNFEYASASEELARGVVSLLLRLGISTRMYKKNIRLSRNGIRKNFTAWRVFITDIVNQEKLLKSFKLIGKEKAKECAIEVLSSKIPTMPNNKFDKVDTCYSLKVSEEMFDLQIEDANNFIANDILVHNSEVFSHEYPTREICYIDSMRFLLIGKTATLAEKYLYVVKDEFESNTRIKTDFGDLRQGMDKTDSLFNKRATRGVEGRRWTQNMFYVVRYGDRTYKDPTMEAVGMGGAITGGRFMRVLAEDIVEVKDCKTKKARDGIEDWFSGVVINLLEPDGKVVVIGTRKHADDLYGRLIKNPSWFYRVDKGILKYPEKYEYIYEEVNGKKTIVDVKMSDEGMVLWNDPSNEHSWSMKKLLLKKAEMLPYIYSREIQNEIMEEKDKLIPLISIEKNFDIIKTGNSLTFIKEHHTKQFLAKIVGCDFSALFDKSKKKESDEHSWTVYTVLGIHRETFDRQVLYVWREQYKNPDEQMSQILWINDHLEPDIFVLEANVFQVIYSYMAGKSGLRNKIISHTTGNEKWSLTEGIPALARDIMNSMYIIPRGDQESRIMTDQLIAGLNGWGIDGISGEETDTTMSLWLATLKCEYYERLARKQREATNKPKSSVFIAGGGSHIGTTPL